MSSVRVELQILLRQRFSESEADRLASELTLLGVEPDFVRRLLAAGRDLPLESPPPRLSQDLRQIYTRGKGFDRELERFQLELAVDSRHADQLAGVRGASLGARYTLSYESPVADVVIDVGSPRDGGRNVDIQVLNRNAGDATVYRASLDNGRPVDGDELGRIELTGVGPGDHQLLLDNGVIEIEAVITL